MLASLGSVSGTTQRLDSFFHGSAAVPAQPAQPVDEIALQIVENRVSLPGLGLMPRQPPGPRRLLLLLRRHRRQTIRLDDPSLWYLGEYIIS